jgi:hypothetical protein
MLILLGQQWTGLVRKAMDGIVDYNKKQNPLTPTVFEIISL